MWSVIKKCALLRLKRILSASIKEKMNVEEDVIDRIGNKRLIR